MITREEALAIYNAGEDTVIQVLLLLSAKIEALEERVKSLEAQIAKNSRNSSKPPSTDGFNKPKPQSLRKKGERKTGGQKGHTGHTLQMVEKPDHIVRYQVERCDCCDISLVKEPLISLEKRQVFDIPPIKLEITEHQAETKKCSSCGRIHKAEFPADVKTPVQYGHRIKGTAAYMMSYQLLPYKRTQEFFHDIFSQNLSEGTLMNIREECSNLLEEPIEQIRELLIKSLVVNFDETGCSVEGKPHWLHASSTPKLTYYEIHKKRGREAMESIGILPNFNGRAIHDFWHSYFHFGCSHGLCNGHLLRELIFLKEHKHQVWAKQMIDFLLEVKETVDKAKTNRPSLFAKEIDEFESKYKSIVAEGFAENPTPEPKEKCIKKRGKQAKSEALNLLLRFRNYRREILAFMYNFNVPFDNNLSERDIRMMKVRQKISGTFRSFTGAKAFCWMRSYISTVRKNEVNVVEAIHDLLAGIPFVPLASSP